MPDPRRRPVRPTDPDVPEVAALGYAHDTDDAPKLLAHARGEVADRIMDLAREYDIPVRKDPTLVAILGALDVGSEIPPELYGVIAEVLAWAYRTDRLAAERNERSSRRRAA